MRTELILPSPENEDGSLTLKERHTEIREQLHVSKPLKVPVLVIECVDVDQEVEVTRLCRESDEDSFKSTPKTVRSVSFNLNLKQTSRRSSSEQKIVRFADVLGLDLADVKHFCWDDPIKVPFVDEAVIHQTKEKHVTVDMLEEMTPKCSLTLVPTFAQPINWGDYFQRLDSQLVLLETCSFRYSKELHGTVRVKNLDFHKRVFVRFSYCENWSKSEEIEAFYVPGPQVGFTDQFEFNIYVDAGHLKNKVEGSEEEKRTLSFACRFECLAKEFWDNNYGLNYRFVAIP